MSEAETIARGLTKAQRRMILAARETALMDRMKINSRSKALQSLGLTVEAWRGGDLLTTMGLAVFAILTEPAPGGGS